MDRSVRIPVLWLALVVLAVLSTWILGHLPWVLDGFRASPDRAGAGTSSEGLSNVRLAIPLVAGDISSLVAFTTIGAIVATLLPLAFPDLPRASAVIAAVLTVAATTLVITFASRSGISSHAADAFAGDERVLDGLVAGVLMVAACAALLGALGAAQIGFLPLAVAVLVGQLPVWLAALSDHRGFDDVAYRLASVVLLTAAFVISVRRSLTWIALWPVALLVVWTALPLRIATNYLQDALRPASGVNADNLSSILADARELFGLSYWRAHQVWWPGVLAVLLALAWVLVRRSSPAQAEGPGPVA